MNAAIFAAIMMAQRNNSTQTRNKLNQDHSNTNCVANRLLLQKGDAITMKIAENEKVISTIIHGYYCNDGYVWDGNINDEKITAPAIEACLQKIIEVSHAKEIQLIPHGLAGDEVTSYLLLLKIDK